MDEAIHEQQERPNPAATRPAATTTTIATTRHRSHRRETSASPASHNATVYLESKWEVVESRTQNTQKGMSASKVWERETRPAATWRPLGMLRCLPPSSL
eukprot:7388897-Pyramimonas_sp.AAC.1